MSQMSTPLTLRAVTDRAERFFADKTVTARRHDGSLDVRTYGETIERARRLAGALPALGVGPGDRVGILAWNHHPYLEAYLGVPNAGFVLHNLNFRLHADDLRHVIGHGAPTVVIADTDQLELLDAALAGVGNVTHVVVTDESGPPPAGWPQGDGLGARTMVRYEELLASADPRTPWRAATEVDPVSICYTSATTAGRPKGVTYTHRSEYLHALAICAADAIAVSERDTVMPVAPFFHANAWGMPYASTWMGAAVVLPGPHPKPDDLADLIEVCGVTLAVGVPTIWIGVLEAQDRRRRDFGALQRIVCGGSAVPRGLAETFETRYGVTFLHAFGMTETTVTHLCRCRSTLQRASRDEQLDQRCSQGVLLPGLDFALVNDQGAPVPQDGDAAGELLLRGPWVADGYLDDVERSAEAVVDGWLHTGDVATVDAHGYLRVVDRKSDLIKSGGEWISSVQLETALMSHAAVAEAAVVAVAHERWIERPVACVVLRPGATATADELLDHLRPSFAKFWLPDEVLFVAEIPKTSVGKFSKRALREQLADRRRVPVTP